MSDRGDDYDLPDPDPSYEDAGFAQRIGAAVDQALGAVDDVLEGASRPGAFPPAGGPAGSGTLSPVVDDEGSVTGEVEVRRVTTTWPDAGGTVVLDDEDCRRLDELGRLRAQQAKLKRDAEALRDRVFQKFKAAKAVQAIATDGRAVARLQVAHPLKVNQHKLEAMYPEVWRDVTDEGETVSVRLL